MRRKVKFFINLSLLTLSSAMFGFCVKSPTYVSSCHEATSFSTSTANKYAKAPIDIPPQKRPIFPELIEEMLPTTEMTAAGITFNSPNPVFGNDENVIIDLYVTPNDNTNLKDYIKVNWYMVDKAGNPSVMPTDMYKMNDVKSLFVNTNNLKNVDEIYAEVSFTNPSGSTNQITTNKLKLNIDYSVHYNTIAPVLNGVNIGTVGKEFPIGVKIEMYSNLYWATSECHNTYIEYKWWASNGFERALYTNLTTTGGFLTSEDSLFDLRQWYLCVSIGDVNTWSNVVPFTPMDEDGSIDPDRPIITDLSIATSDGSDEYFTGDEIIVNSNIEWSVLNPPVMPLTYKWYYIDDLGNYHLIYGQKKDTLKIPAEMKYNGNKLLLRVYYGKGVYAESNHIYLKIFRSVDYPKIKRIELIPNQDKAIYEKGSVATIKPNIIWYNPEKTTAINSYEWSVYDRKGHRMDITSSQPELRLPLQMKDNGCKVLLTVDYTNDDSDHNIVTSDTLRISVWTELVLKNVNEVDKVHMIIIGTTIAFLVVVSIIIAKIGISYFRDHDPENH